MTPEVWQRVNQLFNSARELPPHEREAYLQRETEDAQVRSTVHAMLNADSRTSPLDRQPVPFRSDSRVFTAGQLVAGRYSIRHFLNRGGMGEVYEADDLELRERVALKTLVPDIARDERMLARFKQEIQLSRRVAHPNVCRVFDFDSHITGTDPPVIFLTMEFISGDTLSQRIEQSGPLPVADALPIILQMAGALEAAHSAGVIHRDFKPSNVMLAESPSGVRAVVTDFGLARSYLTPGEGASHQTTMTIGGQMMGTLDYMAPELLAGAPASVASDIYALAMTIWKMLCGHAPYRADSHLAAALLRARMPAPSISRELPLIAPNLNVALRRALDPDPARRYSSVAAFTAALHGQKVFGLSRVSRRAIAGTSIAALVLAACAFGWSRWIAPAAGPSAEANVAFKRGVEDIQGGAYFAATKALLQAVRASPDFSLAHARLAEAWVELDSSESAAREMLLAKRGNLAALPTPDQLQIKAVDLTVTREFPAAVAVYEQMRSSVPDAAGLDLDLGRACEKASLVDKAIQSYLRAATGPAHNPAAWLHLAIIYSRGSQADKAPEAFLHAEEYYQATSNLEGLTETAQQRGIAANNHGRLPEAKAELLKGLDLAQMAGNLQQEVSLKLRLSSNAFLSGDTQTAERYATEAISSARANQMSALAIRGTIGVGNVLVRRSDYAGAEQYYREALDLSQRNGSSRLTALSLMSLATVHEPMRQSASAADEAGAALKYYRENGFARETLQCLTILGRAAAARGDMMAALRYQEQNLEAAEKSRDQFLISLAHESIGRVLADLERLPESLIHFQKELQFATDQEHLGYAAMHCADTLWRMGRYPESIAMARDAESKAEKFLRLRQSLAGVRAEMILSQRRFGDAGRLSRALIGTAPAAVVAASASIYLCLADLRGGERQKGLRECESAMKISNELGDSSLMISARLAYAEAKLANDERSGAMVLLRELESQTTLMPLTLLTIYSIEAQAQSARATELTAYARREVDRVRRQWGNEAAALLDVRPDIRAMMRPLALTFHAIQR